MDGLLVIVPFYVVFLAQDPVVSVSEVYCMYLRWEMHLQKEKRLALSRSKLCWRLYLFQEMTVPHFLDPDLPKHCRLKLTMTDPHFQSPEYY